MYQFVQKKLRDLELGDECVLTKGGKEYLVQWQSDTDALLIPTNKRNHQKPTLHSLDRLCWHKKLVLPEYITAKVFVCLGGSGNLVVEVEDGEDFEEIDAAVGRGACGYCIVDFLPRMMKSWQIQPPFV